MFGVSGTGHGFLRDFSVYKVNDSSSPYSPPYICLIIMSVILTPYLDANGVQKLKVASQRTSYFTCLHAPIAAEAYR